MGVRGALGATVLALGAALLAVPAPAATLELRPCWLRGHAHEARCGVLQRPLDPTQPRGRQIEIHVAVVPALAQRAAPDPVFFFAGGPGQSAIELAGPLARRFARLVNRHDLVFVDQRGTGRSAPLRCPEDDDAAAWQPLPDEHERVTRLAACREALQRLPHGDLRQFTTPIAVADIDAVRDALGAARIDAIGFSYGTRAVLEYQRQFPLRLRRAVLDGVAPPDLLLPRSAATDNQAALDALFDACAADAACARRHPALRSHWQSLLAALPRELRLTQPLSGQPQVLTMTRELLLGMVRVPLYSPALAAALPQAIDDAAAGNWQPLAGLSAALGARGGSASGMHFSVVCAEDQARIEASPDTAKEAGDFGDSFEAAYAEVCAHWPRGHVPVAYYSVTPARAPVLLLSGGADPVTPPRHAARAAQALGPLARHVVVPQAGHGVLALACLRDAATRFITEADDSAALALDFGCAAAVPRPPAFAAPGGGR